jgi:trans-aconitate methyltransferase
METMSFTDFLLERSVIYRLWQAPFAHQKFAPILAHNDLSRVRHVLDVGCGPGTNSRYFSHTRYLGIDINQAYIDTARRRFGLDFEAVDARAYRAQPQDRFDFILVNSFLHHLCTQDVTRLLKHLTTLLTEDGCVHILEPELPPAGSVANLLARADRGKFVRPMADWESIFRRIFRRILLEPYPLKAGGVTLWKMLYFKGSAPAASESSNELME